MASTSHQVLSHQVRDRTGATFTLLVVMLTLASASTVRAEEPAPIPPSYCRLGGCLWEHHGEGQTKYKGKKKVKKKQLVRIACGFGERGTESGIRHIDGHPLLHKDGQPVTCFGSGTIYTTAGEHIIGVGDKEFRVNFEPVKWYAFDWTHYCRIKDAPGFDAATGQLLGFWDKTCVPVPVFGRGTWGSVKTIILGKNPDAGWEEYKGPQPE